MRSVFLVIIIVFTSFQGQLAAQDTWIYKDWYGIGYKGLSHLRIDGKEIEQGEQNFLFGHLKKSPRSATILNIYKKGDLACFIYQNNIEDTNDFMQAITFRKGKDSTYIDMIPNCPEETDTDTATMKKMFYECDSSSYMAVRYYDRKTIERFRLLKPVKNITASDLKKAKELLQIKKDSLRRKFTGEQLLWVEPMLHMQEVKDILLGMGYNPMLTTAQYKSLFNI